MGIFDRHIFFTLLQRGWSILAGGLSLIFIARYLSPVEQGYYYTFASFVAMQVFFDLGFNSVIVQLVSHEFAHVTKGGDGTLTGNRKSLARLSALSHLLNRWYVMAAALFFFIICPFAVVIIKAKADLDLYVWIGAWVIQTLFVSINLYLGAFLAVSEGQGNVGGVAKLRFQQSVAGYLIFWILIGWGAGLWATPALPGSAAIWSSFWVWKRRQIIFPEIDSRAIEPDCRISWRREIFPLQWRIALSWVSGYFIFSFFTPMIFHNKGAVEAGRVGMTLAIFNSLASLGMGWVSAKIPNMSMHIARGERKELNRLFRAVAVYSFLFTALSCAIVVAGICGLRAYGLEAMKRVGSFPVLCSLTVATLTNVLVFSAAAYMRAHKEEPMLANSVTVGVSVLSIVWLCSRVSVELTMMAYTIVMLLVSFPWTLILLESTTRVKISPCEGLSSIYAYYGKRKI